MYPGKKQDSSKNAIYGFTVKVIAILRREKVKTFVDLTRLGLQKFSIPQKKRLENSVKILFGI